jgi:N-acetylglucosamine kinase-like BadF-type ATPase
MKTYYLGVDIGGTKSHALIADGEGNVVGFGVGGSGNHEVVGYQGLTACLQSIVSQALNTAEISITDIAGAGFGVAGYDWPSERQPTIDAIQSLNLNAPLEVVNDAIIGLLTGAEAGWGVALVSGTGTNCWGWDPARRVGRVTGCGWLFGEYGGAYDLVARAVQGVAFAWGKRGPATQLTQVFLEKTGAATPDELLEGLALGKFRLTSAEAPLVVETAKHGDPVAKLALQWLATELGGLAISVIRQLEFQSQAFEVVLVGSLFNAGKILLVPLERAIQVEAPGARLVKLQSPPVVGGVLLGMEAAGLRPQLLRQTLIGNFNNRFEQQIRP